MQDALTIAYSDLIQTQIKLTSTLQSLIDEAAKRGLAPAHLKDL